MSEGIDTLKSPDAGVPKQRDPGNINAVKRGPAQREFLDPYEKIDIYKAVVHACEVNNWSDSDEQLIETAQKVEDWVLGKPINRAPDELAEMAMDAGCYAVSSSAEPGGMIAIFFSGQEAETYASLRTDLYVENPDDV